MQVSACRPCRRHAIRHSGTHPVPRRAGRGGSRGGGGTRHAGTRTRKFVDSRKRRRARSVPPNRSTG
jgi:hypothetical protein